MTKAETYHKKILLIEDDADDRQYFMEAVQETDPSVQCVVAKDGQQALELLQDPNLAPPNYIFLDLRMPKINGRQCLQQIKSIERLKNIPVIIYTTSKDVEEAKALQNMGAVHFISKPSDPDEIYYIISLVLEEQWDAPAWNKN